MCALKHGTRTYNKNRINKSTDLKQICFFAMSGMTILNARASILRLVDSEKCRKGDEPQT